MHLDHGNHMANPPVASFLTELCLVHFHERSPEQLTRKVVNNWKSLGYPAISGEQVRRVHALP